MNTFYVVLSKRDMTRVKRDLIEIYNVLSGITLSKDSRLLDSPVIDRTWLGPTLGQKGDYHNNPTYREYLTEIADTLITIYTSGICGPRELEHLMSCGVQYDITDFFNIARNKI
ncbi:hypothetical protein JXC34_05205 [Candidatus Woesearchaeota archaeon]|nr:hypothetical protein [Candidatus Woesearchaeota archaeon]